MLWSPHLSRIYSLVKVSDEQKHIQCCREPEKKDFNVDQSEPASEDSECVGACHDHIRVLCQGVWHCSDGCFHFYDSFASRPMGMKTRSTRCSTGMEKCTQYHLQCRSIHISLTYIYSLYRFVYFCMLSYIYIHMYV